MKIIILNIFSRMVLPNGVKVRIKVKVKGNVHPRKGH
jgi:hypothetical protein